MRRRDFLAAAAASALARPAFSQSRERTLRFVPQADLANPDPVWTTATVAYNHGFLVWDTPYALDAGYRPQPQMIAGHTLSDDRLTWRFTQREGLAWHDGEPVRSIDFVTSIARWAKRRPLGQIMMTNGAELSTIDDRTFEIRLKKPFALMLTALADYCFIMPERIAKTDAFKQISEYVGSGPFRFLRDEWQPGARAAYARNERYVPRNEPSSLLAGGKVAHFDRVEWIVMPDGSTAGTALQAGEVDWVESPLPDLLPIFRRNPATRVQHNDKIGAIGMAAINHLHPPFDSPKLLRALLAGIDQKEFMQAAFSSEPDLYKTGVGVFTAGLPMANDEGMDVFKADVGLAKKLVSESGYKGERVVLMSPSDQAVLGAFPPVMASLMQKIGINVDLQTTDWGTVIQRRSSQESVEKGGWSMFCTSYTGLSVMDPAVHLPLRGTGKQGWFGWPTDPEMEKLRDSWLETADLATQKQIARKIQARAFETVPFIPFGQYFLATAVRANLTDFVGWPTPVFWNVRRG
jgi:peptide/nickel transport system substrate-binding protein